jgi:hypothetical protein
MTCLEELFFWSYCFILKVPCTWMANFSRFGKFSAIILLNIFSRHLACNFSPSYMSMIYRFDLLMTCHMSCIFHSYSYIFFLPECSNSSYLSSSPDILSLFWCSKLPRIPTECFIWLSEFFISRVSIVRIAIFLKSLFRNLHCYPCSLECLFLVIFYSFGHLFVSSLFLLIILILILILFPKFHLFYINLCPFSWSSSLLKESCCLGFFYCCWVFLLLLFCLFHTNCVSALEFTQWSQVYGWKF